MITDWNRKAEAIFGWSHDEAVGRTLTATIIPRRYREAHRRGMTRFVETGEGRLLGRTVELTALHRDGREFPVEISVSPTSRSGPRVTFVAFVTDISHRRITERLRNVQFAVTRPLADAESWSEAAPQVLQGICETLGWAAAEFWAVDKDANLLRWEHGWYRPSRLPAVTSRLPEAWAWLVVSGRPAGPRLSKTLLVKRHHVPHSSPMPASTPSLPSP